VIRCAPSRAKRRGVCADPVFRSHQGVAKGLVAECLIVHNGHIMSTQAAPVRSHPRNCEANNGVRNGQLSSTYGYLNHSIITIDTFNYVITVFGEGMLIHTIMI